MEEDSDKRNSRNLNMNVVSIAAENLHVFLPHCLSKVNSVSHGLIRHQLPEDESVNRKYMSVSFVGKDTPAAAAEFSHPDILIMLTWFAYRYGGLRVTDGRLLVTCLKNKMRKEHGPLQSRTSWLLFNSLVKHHRVQSPLLPLHMFLPDDDIQINN